MSQTTNRTGVGTARTCVLVVVRVALLALFASGCAEGTPFDDDQQCTDCVCGDGTCNGEESTATCTSDCGSSCGDGVCNGAESTATCIADCGLSCGDGACNGAESTTTCTADCGSSCGDGACTGSEGCGSCEVDCGVCETIFVVDAPNDSNTTRRTVVPGDGTRWPDTVSQTFDHSTGGQSATGLSGTLYVSGTGFFEPQQLPYYYNTDYAGDMTPSHTAIWTATGYQPGKEVTVFYHWAHQGNYATVAPLSINGGASVEISMRIAPVGDLVLNDGVKDVNFQLLGSGIADGSGQVQVVLSGQNDWAPVDAMAFVSSP